MSSTGDAEDAMASAERAEEAAGRAEEAADRIEAYLTPPGDPVPMTDPSVATVDINPDREPDQAGPE